MTDSASPAHVVATLYSSFARKDHEAMGACYADDATFSDPVFVDLKGIQVRAMWRMLCERGADLALIPGDVHVNGDVVTTRWIADYTFSATKRKVHNVVDARLTVKDNKIVAHTDHFSLWRWTSMALGPRGLLLGWTPFVQDKVRAEARKGLELFMKRKRIG